MKKSDTEQEQPGLEENKVSDSQSKRELDRELQELAEKEHQEEIYYEERRRERHERNLKRKKRQIRNRNLALIITALAVLGGVGYFYREQTGLKDGMETLVAKVRDLVPDKNSGKESKAAEELAKATENPESPNPPKASKTPILIQRKLLTAQTVQIYNRNLVKARQMTVMRQLEIQMTIQRILHRMNPGICPMKRKQKIILQILQISQSRTSSPGSSHRFKWGYATGSSCRHRYHQEADPSREESTDHSQGESCPV